MHPIRLLAKASWPLLLAVLAAFAGGMSPTKAAPTLAPAGQGPGPQAALTTGFTFHGQLVKGGSPYTGLCDFSFSLWDAASAGTQIGSTQVAPGLSVSAGVFATVLNDASQFGASAFDGSARWLSIQVQCTGDATPADLGRQALLATPYASSVSAGAGNSVVSAINDPATTGKINSSRLGSDVLLMNPSAAQVSTGNADLGQPVINLSGGTSTIGTYSTVFKFKVQNDGGMLASGRLGIGTIPLSGDGYRLMWYPFKAAFRAGYASAAGEWDDANIGFYSWAGGNQTTASAFGAFAFGDQSIASGVEAVAFGSSNKATGTVGLAIGANNIASGFASTAIGFTNLAGGQGSVALGYRNVAAGDYSVALGYRASTASCTSVCDINNPPLPIHTGSFVFADQSSTNWFSADGNNQFAVRASGGFRFRTNSTGSTGCDLPVGTGVFSCASDRNLKERFTTLNGEAVLSKIAAMPIQGWSYKDDPLKTNHLGPVAQDFFGAFGLGQNDKTIGLLDIAGVNMLAIQALENRTSQVGVLEARVTELEAEKAAQQQQFDSLESRLAALERAPGESVAMPAFDLNGLWFFVGGLLVAGLALGARRFVVAQRGLRR
jgi:trimeric autotransporter adhesin